MNSLDKFIKSIPNPNSKKDKKPYYKYNKRNENYEGRIILYDEKYYVITNIIPTSAINITYVIKNIENNFDIKHISSQDATHITNDECTKIEKAQLFTEKYNECIKKINGDFSATDIKYIMEITDKKKSGITSSQLDNIIRHLLFSSSICFDIHQITKNPFDFIQQDVQIISYEKAEKICELYNISISFETKCQKWSYDFIRLYNCFYVESRRFWDHFHHYCEAHSKNYEQYCSIVNKVVIDKIIDGKYYKTTAYLFELEKKMGDIMMNLYHEKKYNISIDTILEKIQLFEQSMEPGFKLEKEQIDAVVNSILFKLNVFYGYPGTGKSLIISCILFVFKTIYQKEEKDIEIPVAIAISQNPNPFAEYTYIPDANIISNIEEVEADVEIVSHVYVKDECKYVKINEISILAPTGLAYLGLKNKCEINDKIKKNANTTDSYLFNTQASGTCHRVIYHMFPKVESSSETAKQKLIIIDEVSMLDTFMFHHILKYCVASDCRLILVGDNNQLPSIGPGCILKNIINSALFNKVLLTKIKRQNAGVLVNNIKQMNERLITLNDFTDDSMIFLDIKDFTDEYDSFKKLIDKYQLSSNNTKFLTYFNKKTYKFNVGDVNKIIQAIFNTCITNKQIPPNLKWQSDKCVFKENDMIVRIVNSYTKGDDIRANGEMAKIVSFDDNNKVIIRYLEDNTDVRTNKNDLYDDFELAYALTVHKSQGSQFDNIVIFIDVNQNSWDKTALYTAISRAKNKCIIIAKYDDFLKTQSNKRNIDDKISLFLKEFNEYEIEI